MVHGTVPFLFGFEGVVLFEDALVGALVAVGVGVGGGGVAS